LLPAFRFASVVGASTCAEATGAMSSGAWRSQVLHVVPVGPARARCPL
jgi:hypothetical protein